MRLNSSTYRYPKLKLKADLYSTIKPKMRNKRTTEILTSMTT